MSLTHREHFKLHGGRPIAAIEALLDTAEDAEDMCEIEAHISEAAGQFPEEDFLHEHVKRLTALQKCVRGDNKVEVESILADLEDALDTMRKATEYGREELKLAQVEIDKIYA